jgi:hypothetical protein
LPLQKNRHGMASGCWMLLVFSFFFFHLFGIYPVNGENCPLSPPRNWGVTKKNAIPQESVAIHLSVSRLQLIWRSREAPV